MQELKGLGVAMITPFRENGSVDFAGLERLVKHLHSGADFLVVMGTTGEAATLTADEQSAVLEFIIEINAGKLPIVYGLGGSNTKDVAARMGDFDPKGVTAFLTASPAYSRPTQEGIYQHYAALNEATALPIILYNVPARTGSNVLPATVARIAESCKKIVAIKEAAGSIEQVMELARLLPKDFLLLSGDDSLLLPHMACGGHGIISVAGNAFPAKIKELITAATANDYGAAQKLQYELAGFIRTIFKEGNPGGIKEAMRHLSISEPYLRLPLVPVSAELSKEIYREIAEIG